MSFQQEKSQNYYNRQSISKKVYDNRYSNEQFDPETGIYSYPDPYLEKILPLKPCNKPRKNKGKNFNRVIKSWRSHPEKVLNKSKNSLYSVLEDEDKVKIKCTFKEPNPIFLANFSQSYPLLNNWKEVVRQEEEETTTMSSIEMYAPLITTLQTSVLPHFIPHIRKTTFNKKNTSSLVNPDNIYKCTVEDMENCQLVATLESFLAMVVSTCLLTDRQIIKAFLTMSIGKISDKSLGDSKSCLSIIKKSIGIDSVFQGGRGIRLPVGSRIMPLWDEIYDAIWKVSNYGGGDEKSINKTIINTNKKFTELITIAQVDFKIIQKVDDAVSITYTEMFAMLIECICFEHSEGMTPSSKLNIDIRKLCLVWLLLSTVDAMYNYYKGDLETEDLINVITDKLFAYGHALKRIVFKLSCCEMFKIASHLVKAGLQFTLQHTLICECQEKTCDSGKALAEPLILLRLTVSTESLLSNSTLFGDTLEPHFNITDKLLKNGSDETVNVMHKILEHNQTFEFLSTVWMGKALRQLDISQPVEQLSRDIARKVAGHIRLDYPSLDVFVDPNVKQVTEEIKTNTDILKSLATSPANVWNQYTDMKQELQIIRKLLGDKSVIELTLEEQVTPESVKIPDTDKPVCTTLIDNKGKEVNLNKPEYTSTTTRIYFDDI